MKAQAGTCLSYNYVHYPCTLWPAGEAWKGPKKKSVGAEIDIGRFRRLFVPLPLSESKESLSPWQVAGARWGRSIWGPLYWQFQPRDRWDSSQAAGQPDYDESDQDSPVTFALKAGEIMHQRLYVELCAARCVAARECEVEIMYGCCHAQRSLFNVGRITELRCRRIWIEMLQILYILLECKVNNSSQSNSQEPVRDLLLLASTWRRTCVFHNKASIVHCVWII